jgi:hypothetical protein
MKNLFPFNPPQRIPMKSFKLASLAAAVTLALSLGGIADRAQAAVVSTLVPFSSTTNVFPGNDCQRGFSRCELNGSPIIAKFDFNSDGSLATNGVELNTSVFPGLLASWFTIDAVNRTWRYDPQGAGPGITAFASKAGNGYLVYSLTPTYFGGSQVFSFNTPEGRDLSHISFYDTRATVVPLPAGAWLMLSGMAGLGVISRRKRAAA